jgi:hypothetical protein
VNKSQLTRLEQIFQLDDGENPRLPASPEERRQLLADGLPSLCVAVFGADDPRADPARLAAMTTEELRVIYWQALQHDIATYRATNPPQLEAFHRLPTSEKIRLLRRDYRNWPAELRH